MALNIRKAEPKDFYKLLLMAELMHRESPRYSKMPFVLAKATASIRNLMNTGGAFVAEMNGDVIGMLGGVVIEHFFSSAKFSIDFVLYVLPKYRGSSAAVRLVKAYEEWAFAQGAEEVGLGASTGIATEQTVCIYERMGYKIASYTCIKTKG